MKEILLQQRSYFNSNVTKDVEFRKRMLDSLYLSIKNNANEIYEALKMDLNKGSEEAYLTEIQIVMEEIRTAKKNLNKWARKERKITPLVHFPSSSFVYNEPYGCVLILAPWNYPFQLAMTPLVGAIAGGNCAFVKPSRTSSNVNDVICKIIKDAFNSEYIYCIPKSVSNEAILEEKYDLIFFTGSENAGKVVMAAASKHLTPTVLELGGKSPCIIDRTANLKIAANRIAWGKFLNAGQTCVAPDYVLVHRDVKEEFITLLTERIRALYGEMIQNDKFVHIISDNRFNKLLSFINEEDNKIGGAYDVVTRCIEPTIFTNASFDDPIMQEEIFGPILPIIEMDSLAGIIDEIKRRPRPLAVYLFTRKKDVVDKVINSISFGGGCVNDVIMHVANKNIPFGGVGSSGMGCYHGKYSYDTFTRKKGVEIAKNYLDLPLRYPPYGEAKMKLIKKIMK